MKSIRSTMVAAVLGFAACQAAPASLTEADLAAIAELRATVISTSLAGDAEGAAALYTDNGLQLPPNAPAVRGHAAIVAASEAEGQPSTFELTPLETWGIGEFAYDRGTYELSVSMGVEGMPDYHEVGKYLVLLQKQADGSWKMTTAMWSPDALPPAPPTSGT